ncbi:MAG TPA: hypothetical protein VGG33_16890 [Polyangia bacterium]
MHSLTEADWSVIEALRKSVGELSKSENLVEASEGFTKLFATKFASIVLARMFVVVPFSALPAREQQQARASKLSHERTNDDTLCLCLLGSFGKENAWKDRRLSVDHLAIPLLDAASVSEAPMIAKLLGDLEVDLRNLATGTSIATRMMVGGRNGTFYVPDAPTAVDAQGRAVIPAEDFVKRFQVKTVFGMGGAYLDGTLVVAILFTSESLDRLVVDRFPSFISSFKMATASLVAQGQIFPAATA